MYTYRFKKLRETDEKFTWRHHVVKLVKAEGKENILKAAKEYARLTYRGKRLERYWISHQKPRRPDGRMLGVLSTQNSVSSKISFMVEGKSRHPQVKGDQES